MTSDLLLRFAGAPQDLRSCSSIVCRWKEEGKKRLVQFDGCTRRLWKPWLSRGNYFFFTNTQSGQAEHNLIWVHIWDQTSGGFSIEDTSASRYKLHSIDIYCYLMFKNVTHRPEARVLLAPQKRLNKNNASVLRLLDSTLLKNSSFRDLFKPQGSAGSDRSKDLANRSRSCT